MSGIQVAYPDQLPCPTAAPLSPTLRVLQSDLPGPTGYRGFQRDFHATQQLEWMLTAQQAQAFDVWWNTVLHKGGLWFSANWPLMAGRANNVYRFLSTPSWQYIAGGPDGGGMHRVRAAVEVRGRGEVPRDYDYIVITSRPYPLLVEESMGVGFGFGGGAFAMWPVDHMPISFSFVSGELREPIVDYAPLPEHMGVTFGFLGGELRETRRTYANWPAEAMTFGFAFTSGQLQDVRIAYSNWPAEQVGVGFSFLSGILE